MLAFKCGGASKLMKVKLFLLDQSSFPVKWWKHYHTVKLIRRVQQDDMFLEKKKQKKIFNFFFCTEYVCNGMFRSQLHLDQHRLSGAHDYGNRPMWNIHLQKRLSSHHISLLTQVILTQLLQLKKVLHQHKLWCSWKKVLGNPQKIPKQKNSIIQKNRKAFWWNTLRRENKLVLKEHQSR